MEPIISLYENAGRAAAELANGPAAVLYLGALPRTKVVELHPAALGFAHVWVRKPGWNYVVASDGDLEGAERATVVAITDGPVLEAFLDFWAVELQTAAVGPLDAHA